MFNWIHGEESSTTIKAVLAGKRSTDGKGVIVYYEFTARTTFTGYNTLSSWVISDYSVTIVDISLVSSSLYQFIWTA